MLGLIKQPLSLALTVAEGALDASLALVRVARGLVKGDEADARWGVADPSVPSVPSAPADPSARDSSPSAAKPSPPSAPSRPARPRPRPAPAAPAPAPPPAPGDDHVSEEPVPVAEFAEAGAEDGASAELTIAEPWDGYARQDARAIVRELSNASREKLAAVELYEHMHKKRRSVLDAAERRLKALSGPAAPRTR